MSSVIKRHRQTKIIATLGPATASEEKIRHLFLAGVDVFRLNFSHGSHEDHKASLKKVRQIEKETGRPIGIFADLQGPKLRIGSFADGKIGLKKDQTFQLDLDSAPGDETRVCLPHPEIFSALEEGSEILLDDGRIQLSVIEKGKDFAKTRVIAGQSLSDRKGVNLPGAFLPVSPLTKKDRKDLEIALDMGVDWIALSFVQKPENITEARDLIKGRAKLITKLEKPLAIDHLPELVELSDALMIARGDLGVEIPSEKVPGLQKRIVRTARLAGKPVIVATQMLESMTVSPRPTRAEASDVATAIYDGADAVMLSAETASGNYPIEAVAIMNKIAAEVEKDKAYRRIMDAEHPKPDHTCPDAITAAAYAVASLLDAAAIVNYTTSGSTTLRTARERPPMTILCLTESLATARCLQLSYGVHSVHTKDVDSFRDMVNKAARIAAEHKLARKGDLLVITAGVPFGTPGSTNILRVARVGE